MTCKDVLLLGGTGFIGSALAKRLKQEKKPVHIIGRCDIAQLEQVLIKCTTVIHLASATTPSSSAAHPWLEQKNLKLTLRLLDLMYKHPGKHLAFFSSGGTIYGNPEQLPVPENALVAPLSNYGAGKAAQELFCRTHRASGLSVTILRPANTYGPGQPMHRGFGLVRTLLEHAQRGTPLTVWGDGENIRDYIYIDDVVDACIRVIEKPEDSNTYNLGSGTGYSIKQIIGIVEQLTGTRIPIKHEPARGEDVHAITLDTTLFEEKLGWRAKTPLEEGIKRTWEWLKQA